LFHRPIYQDSKLKAAAVNGGEDLLEYLQDLIAKVGIPKYEDPPYPEPRKLTAWKDDFVYEVDPKDRQKTVVVQNTQGEEKLRQMQQQMLQHNHSKKSQPRPVNTAPGYQAPARTQSGAQPRVQAKPATVQHVQQPAPVRQQPVAPPEPEPEIDEIELMWVSTTLEVLSAKLGMAIESIETLSAVEELTTYVNQIRQLKVENAKALNFVKIKAAQPEPADDKFSKAKQITICGFKDTVAILEAFSQWTTQNPSPQQFEQVVQIIRAIKDLV